MIMQVVRKALLIAAGAIAGLPLAALGLAAGEQGNPLGWFVAILGLGYFLGGAVYLVFMSDESAWRGEPGDRSVWLLAPGFLVVFYGAPLEYLLLPAWLPHTTLMQGLGIFLIAAGLVLRLWVRRALGPRYSGFLQIQEHHQLVRAGPYRRVRHPGYTGFLLLALGLGVGFSSLIAIAAVFVLLLPGLAYRMRAEERMLLERFGDEYRAYAQATKRVIPGVY